MQTAKAAGYRTVGVYDGQGEPDQAGLRQAAEAVKAGDHARAQAILQPVLQTEQAQALLQKLDG